MVLSRQLRTARTFGLDIFMHASWLRKVNYAFPLLYLIPTSHRVKMDQLAAILVAPDFYLFIYFFFAWLAQIWQANLG